MFSSNPKSNYGSGWSKMEEMADEKMFRKWVIAPVISRES